MKRSKFTEAQVAFILRQAEEGTAVGEVCRKAGISAATYYNWRQKSKELPKSAAETAHAGLLAVAGFPPIPFPAEQRQTSSIGTAGAAGRRLRRFSEIREHVMTGELKGCTIAVLATDGVEQVELTEPVKALKGVGAEVKVVSDKKSEIQAFKHHDKATKIRVDESLDQAEPKTSTA